MKTLEGKKKKTMKKVAGKTFGDLWDLIVERTFKDKDFMEFAKSTKRCTHK